jgi:hypothetical protein
MGFEPPHSTRRFGFESSPEKRGKEIKRRMRKEGEFRSYSLLPVP